MAQSSEILERLGKIELYVHLVEITIVTDEIAQATDVDVRKSSTANFSPGLIGIFEVSTIKLILALACNGAAE